MEIRIRLVSGGMLPISQPMSVTGVKRRQMDKRADNRTLVKYACLL
ncbi:MAG: hypothetical protein NT047_16695 [Deltaproteobacteria bacterium]|nr:hypothetical protein [Deltaproteobacteria bacterium]